MQLSILALLLVAVVVSSQARTYLPETCGYVYGYGRPYRGVDNTKLTFIEQLLYINMLVDVTK